MSGYTWRGRGAAEIEAALTRRTIVPLEEARYAAIARRLANTAGDCQRGCCWTPWSPGVCAVSRMCNCHYAPAAETPREEWADVHDLALRFSTSTEDFEAGEAA